MRITALVENTTASAMFGSEHGLSILIRTEDAVLLFDTGCGGLFLENADKLGMDLAEVTHLILSHGHYDHGGGIPAFLVNNSRAKVYLRKEALDPSYAIRTHDEVEYIGLPLELAGNSRLYFTHDRMEIAPGVTLYSDIPAREPIPETNHDLMMKQEGVMLPDTFPHEQVAEIREGDRILLLTGCSHHGIRNILWHYQERSGRIPDLIIGGFHLHSHRFGRAQDDEIRRTAEALAGTGALVYTCHCTGLPAYEELKKSLGEQICYLSGGRTIEF
ncbi:MAG: MBL fold metallo-hydrolase [Desulfobulbus sp.]|nr:MBL fold metallo-hydrolase [Desulfobulbus sp.]